MKTDPAGLSPGAMYSKSAALYDLIATWGMDYPAEAGKITDLIRPSRPQCRTLLEVACGTAEHARYLSEVHGFGVDGIDLEPACIAIARAKCPRGRFDVADMTDFHLGRCYDGVLLMAGSIGHVVTLRPRVRETLACLREHLAGGVVVVQPFLTPDTFQVGTNEWTAASGDLRVTRVRRSERDGQRGWWYFHDTVEGPDGPRESDEVHEFGLFTAVEMLAAFTAVGLTATFDLRGPGRGAYVASVSA
jgi:SAM-dependent methyltransferase